MKGDAELKMDVMRELKWEPNINTEVSGIAVKDGVVALSGDVDSYTEEVAAERVAQRVLGVKAIARQRIQKERS